MCFTPQKRALFAHFKFEKYFGLDVFQHWAGKCALCHSGVGFCDGEGIFGDNGAGFFISDLMCFL